MADKTTETGPKVHPLTQRLRDLIQLKKSNLCVSADITSAPVMLDLARRVGPSIVVFKTHADILIDWDTDRNHGTGAHLKAIAKEYNFLIFEDRKFADIGSTCQLQYCYGDLRIVEWADIINAHILPGPDAVRALRKAAVLWERSQPQDGKSPVDGELPLQRGLLLIAQMSTAGNFLDDKYTENCVEIARQYRDFVMGFVAQKPLNSEPEDSFITMTPGCALSRLESSDDAEFDPRREDALGQQYNTPRTIMLRGCDIIIVGRGICDADNPAKKAEQYRKSAWDAYEELRSPSKTPQGPKLGSREWVYEFYRNGKW